MCMMKEGIALSVDRTKQKRILLIINPNAGVIKKEFPFKELIITFAEYGYETIPCFTRAAGDGTVLVQEHAGEDIAMVVAVGGDGTLNEVVAGVCSIGLSIPVGYIPAGSTNDFAASLGLSFDPVEAAEQIMTGEIHSLDLGEFNGRTFIYTACCGIFSRVSYETPQRFKNRLGHFAYLLEGIKDIRDFIPIPMKIKAGDNEYRDNFIFVAMCNTFSLGGIMSLEDTNVDLSDGQFEMLLISRPNDLAELRQIVRALYEQTYDSPYVKILKVTDAEICYKAKDDWSLDGERGKAETKNSFRVIPGGLRLVY